MVSWLIAYACVGFVVLFAFRLFAVQREHRSLRTIFYQPGFFGLNDHDSQIQRALLVAVLMALMFLWPVLVIVKSCLALHGTASEAGEAHSPRFIKPKQSPNINLPLLSYAGPTKTLVCRVSIAEAEAQGQITDPLDGVPDLPFGFFHAAWLKFLADMQVNDELWSFTTQPADGRSGFSSRHVSGYRLLRDGEIVGEFITESA